MTILNIFNIIFISSATFYAYLIGKKIGFSKPWKYISFGLFISAIGCFIRIIGSYNLPTSNEINILDVGILISIISYIFVLSGFTSLYKFLKDVK